MEVVVKNRENILQKKMTLKKELIVEGESTFEDVVVNGDVTNKGDVVNEGDVTFEGNVVMERAIKNSAAVGTPLDDEKLECIEYGDGVNHVTRLFLNSLTIGSAVAAANLAFGKLLYTLPAGAQIIEAVYMRLSLKSTGAVTGDTPDVGIGSVMAGGDVNVLGGTGTFEDYITGQTSPALSTGGTAPIEVASGATAGVLTGIALNLHASAKTVHLNIADGWTGAGDVVALGSIVIVWKTLY